MNFNYNREYQTLEVTTDTGMLQSIHIPEQYLEKLYFMLWAEMHEIKAVCERMQERDSND